MCDHRRWLIFVRLALLSLLLFTGLQSAYGQEDEVFARSVSQAGGGGKYRWTIYIEASSSLRERITCVEYRLPPSYRQSTRKLCAPKDKYPFKLSDTATDSLDVGVTVYFNDNKYQVLPVYSLQVRNNIDNPGGVPITPKLHLAQRKKMRLPIAELQDLTLYVGDIHDTFKHKTWPLQIYKNSDAIPFIDSLIYSGKNVYVPFNYNGQDYVLSGYTETSWLSDSLYFRIFRKK